MKYVPMRKPEKYATAKTVLGVDVWQKNVVDVPENRVVDFLKLGFVIVKRPKRRSKRNGKK